MLHDENPNSTPAAPALIDMRTLEQVAPVLRNVAHPLRLRILDYIQQRGEPCTVSDIITACEGAEQAVVSQHLRILKDQKIVQAKRRGNFVLYDLCDPSVIHVLNCVRSRNTQK